MEVNENNGLDGNAGGSINDLTGKESKVINKVTKDITKATDVNTQISDTVSDTVDATVNTQVSDTISDTVDATVSGKVGDTISTQVSTQVSNLLLKFNKDNMSVDEIQKKFGLRERRTFSRNYIQPALKLGLIAMTIPDKPNSRLQKYRLTSKGKELKEKLTLKIGKEQ